MLSKAGILQLGNYFIALLRIDSPFQGAGFRLQKPLNPLSLCDFPLLGSRLAPAQPLNPSQQTLTAPSRGTRPALHYASTAAIFKENLADVPPRRLMPPGPASLRVMRIISP